MVVYLITNTINGKYYVGKTVETLASRWSKHKNEAARGSNMYLHRAMRKYGLGNFTVHPLMETLKTNEELCEQETFLISLFKANDHKHGYNLTTGGEGVCGLRHSLETKEKLRSLRLKQVFTPEQIAKHGLAWKGKKRPPFSLEHRQHLSEGRTGMTLSAQHRQHIGESHIGKKHSPESIQRMSEAKQGTAPSPESRSTGGLRSTHVKWHVNRGIAKDGCSLCQMP